MTLVKRGIYSLTCLKISRNRTEAAGSRDSTRPPGFDYPLLFHFCFSSAGLTLPCWLLATPIWHVYCLAIPDIWDIFSPKSSNQRSRTQNDLNLPNEPAIEAGQWLVLVMYPLFVLVLWSVFLMHIDWKLWGSFPQRKKELLTKEEETSKIKQKQLKFW